MRRPIATSIGRGNRTLSGLLTTLLALGVLPAAVASPAVAASRPGTVTSVRATKANAAGFTITWAKAAHASRYQLVVARNKSMTSHRATYSLRKTHKTFKHVAPGYLYYARVRAVRGGRTGHYSKKITAAPWWVYNKRAVATSTSKATVTWVKLPGATSYRIKVSRDKHQTQVVGTWHSKKAHKTISVPRTIPGRTYWYRVIAERRGHVVKTSALAFLNPSVGAPTGARAASSTTSGLTLTWRPSANAQRYVITVAANRSLTSGVHRYTSTSPVGRFAPPNLAKGRTYYFRVRAANDSTSRSSGVFSGRLLTSRLSVVTGSFNIRKTPGLSWGPRRAPVKSLILNNGFDVIGLQEANTDDNFKYVKSDVRGAFTSNANCERKDAAHPDARSKILFRTSKFTGSTSVSGSINLDHSTRSDADFACYQLLTSKSQPHAKFLFVSTHDASGTGRAYDDRRYRQIANLLADVKKHNTGGWPVVYAGDYNSSASSKYTYDAPARRFNAAALLDANHVSSRHTNASYNSANQLSATPIRTGNHIDHIYVSPTVAVTDWRVIVRLRGSRYATPFASDHNPIRSTVQIPC